jgi:hypothetical protein
MRRCRPPQAPICSLRGRILVALAGLWAAAGGAACRQDDAALERLRDENGRLKRELEERKVASEKELAACKEDVVHEKLKCATDEAHNVVVKYGGPPGRSSPPSRDGGACQCVPDDPLCSCL